MGFIPANNQGGSITLDFSQGATEDTSRITRVVSMTASPVLICSNLEAYLIRGEWLHSVHF